MNNSTSVNRIKETMLMYGFKLTNIQIGEYLKDHPVEHGFDTVEREDYIQWLGLKITGMAHPKYGDSEGYKEEYYSKLKEFAPEKGYKILIE